MISRSNRSWVVHAHAPDLVRVEEDQAGVDDDTGAVGGAQNAVRQPRGQTDPPALWVTTFPILRAGSPPRSR